MVMFVPQPTSHSSLWEGGSAGNDGAIKHFQADEVGTSQFQRQPTCTQFFLQALPLAEMPNHLQTIAPSATTIYFDMPPARSRRSLKRTFLDSLFPGQDIESVVGKLPAGKLRSLNESVQHLRSVKSPAEIEIMRRAARISSKGHASVRRPLPSSIALVCSAERRVLVAIRRLWVSRRPPDLRPTLQLISSTLARSRDRNDRPTCPSSRPEATL